MLRYVCGHNAASLRKTFSGVWMRSPHQQREVTIQSEQGAGICLSYMRCPKELGVTIRSPARITNDGSGGSDVGKESVRYEQLPSYLLYFYLSTSHHEELYPKTLSIT